MNAVKYALFTAGGVALGYLVAKDRLERQYYERLNEAEKEAKAFYRRQYMEKAKAEGEDEGVTLAAVDAAEAIKKNSGYTVGPSVLTQEMEQTVANAMAKGELLDLPDVPDGEPEDRVMGPYSKADVAAMEARYKALNEEAEELGAVTGPEVQERVLAAFTEPAKKTPAPKVNYNHISTPPKVSEPVTSEGEETGMRADSPAPEIITRDSFIEDQFGYKQFTLSYWVGDDVLSNQSDDPVEGEARTAILTDEILEKLKVGRDAMDGQDELYIRDHERNVEMEIVRSPLKYWSSVHNQTE